MKYTPEQIKRAYAKAARELGMPPRGPAGSTQNVERSVLGPRVFRRAIELLKVRGSARAKQRCSAQQSRT